VKRLLKKLAFGGYPVAEYPVLGLHDPQTLVTARLEHRGFAIDATLNNVIVSLRPLRVAVSLPPERQASLSAAPECELVFSTKVGNQPLGSVLLDYEEFVDLGPGHRLCLFGVTGYRNRCVPRWRAAAIEAVRARAARRSGQTFSHQMSRPHLRAFYVLYTSPRPVALVSFEQEGAGNMFPMDLIGPVDGGRFLLSLHDHSPALERIELSGRLAVSTIPIELTGAVYALGKNHRHATVPWAEMPLDLYRTTELGLPAPVPALTVRELRIDRLLRPGSHVVFVTEPLVVNRRADGLAMHHTQGFCLPRIEEPGNG
jgi:flavin reductase (DIM6/NTAB) family NADH-FMN oxidoreductase RutF